ncbi:MAG: DUF2079 domain-containing protein [Ktedonobacteraceae bacterium]|nr:DUF2079 domain-containing protein [Ktedonobacteraceae bacterium]
MTPDLMSQQRQIRIAWIILVAGMLAYATFMGWQSVLRYETFKATAFDLGNMDQAVWNTIHGRLFQFTNQGIDWYGPPIRLAVHFEPILLPISLLYLFFPDPRTLLIFQTLALAAGALPVFLLARKHLPQWPLLAALLALSYLLMPALIGLNIFDFHPVSLATPLLLYALLALDSRRYGWFVVACFFAALCKEDIPFSVALLGILVLWKYRMPRLGSGLMAGGLLYGIFAFMVIRYFYPGVQGNNFWYRYESLGSTPGEAIVNILSHPWLLFTTFITLDRLYYLFNLLRNQGFLSLLAPEWFLPALPSLAINLLSTYPLYYSGVYHYNAAIIPFVMISAIYGLRRAVEVWQGWSGEQHSEKATGERASGVSWSQPGQQRQRGQPAEKSAILQPVALLLRHGWQVYTGAVRAVAAGPVFTHAVAARIVTLKEIRDHSWQRLSERMVPLARSLPFPRVQWVIIAWFVLMIGLNQTLMHIPLSWVNWADHMPGAREQHIQQILDMIPPDATVSAGNNLNPHLSERQYVTLFPELTYTTEQGIRKTVQYVVVDLNYVFPEDKVSTAKVINQLINSKSFRVLARAEGVVLLVRQNL